MRQNERPRLKPVIITFAGSTRRQSLNRTLAISAAEEAEHLGAEGVFVDLAEYPLPLYDGDLEDLEGVPANAMALAELIRRADGLFIASPEYNGAYSALLKNTLDWLSRIDRNILSLPTAIASASPGRRGGASGLRALRAILEHMRAPVIDHQLSVPNADTALSRSDGANARATEAIRDVMGSLLRQVQLEKPSVTASLR
jgi:NAD(P)H-dependent FMN reductase